MMSIHRLGRLSLMALLLASFLGACGESIGPVPQATAGPGSGTPAAVPDAFAAANANLEAGIGYMAAGDSGKATDELNKAIAAFEAIVAQDPGQVSARTNLGVAYYNVGRLDDAIAQYEEALKLAPNDADIHSNLAAAYVQQAQAGGAQLDAALLEKATAEYKKAVAIDPELAEAYFGLGVISLALGKNDEARQAFESFIQYDDGQDARATSQAQQYLEQLKNR